MSHQTLAVKYRPTTWEDMSGQESIKTILAQQIKDKSFKNAYLFSGSSGCGKTTSARIFANMINNGKGTIIEIDGASNNGVDNVRQISEDAKKKSLNSEYKIFIVDECHALSNAGWQAFLKTLEDCPRYTIFIFCTTNPEKLPLTVLNRLQRYDFNNIPTDEISQRLRHIATEENINIDDKSISYISRLANGGMRDAISMLDKVQSLHKEIKIDTVLKSLGTVDFDTFFELAISLQNKDTNKALEIIDSAYHSGKSITIFMAQFRAFMVDVCKYVLFGSFDCIAIPRTTEYEEQIKQIDNTCYIHLDFVMSLHKMACHNLELYTLIQASIIQHLRRC